MLQNVKNEKGLTLIELLITMFILGFIMITMFRMLDLSYSTMDKEIMNQEVRDEVRVFSNYLMQDLVYTDYVKVTNNGTFDVLVYKDFKGNNKIIKFSESEGLSEIIDGRENLIVRGVKHKEDKPMVWKDGKMINFNFYAKDVNVLLYTSISPRAIK